MPEAAHPFWPCDYGSPLGAPFFERSTLEVAPALLGCVLVSLIDGSITAGRIVETEAYLDSDDPGSHAATKGITKRNAVMYGEPGRAYVYFTYGNHHMLNIVCEPAGTAGAVLIRALAPLEGQAVMRSRRGDVPDPELCNGPGKLAKAFGVDLSDNGTALGAGRLGVYSGVRPVTERVMASGRIGLRRGHELEYRYYLSGDPHVSRGRTGPANGSRVQRKNTGGSRG